MVPNADISPGLNALAQGLQQYRGNQRRNALELALPQAMAGDQAAQNRLLALDPNLGMQVQNNRAQQAEGRRTLIKDTLTQDALAMAHMTDEQLAQAFPQRAQRWLEQFPELQGKITPDFDQTVRPTIMGLAGIKPETPKAPPLESWQNADGSINQELYEAARGLKTANTQLRIENPSAAAASPYYQAVPTPQGYMRFNARTGQMESITVGGNVPLPIAADPNNKRDMERAGAEGRTIGEATAEGALGAPQAVARADQILSDIDNTLRSPGLNTATGLSGAIDPRNYVPGSQARDARVRIEQVQGQAFLQAFESLKGGGAITEKEGQAATAAFARLNRAQSDDEFRKSLMELRTIIGGARERAARKASAAPELLNRPEPAQPRNIQVDY